MAELNTAEEVNSAANHSDPVFALRLRRYDWIGTSSGAFVLLLGLSLVVHGFGWSPRPLPYVFFGFILADAGGAFILFFRRTSTRQQWILRHCPAVAMRLRIVVDDRGEGHFARLYAESGDVVERSALFVLPVQAPADEVPSTGELIPCSVYFDPESGSPAAIQTEDTVYWVRG
ncbi:MAG: hypothetical protein IH600_07970 [Bacteroidetes bacterium]|nr:hypothetical protein [Bacteroidota bacterium]